MAKTSEALRKAVAKYDKENTVFFGLKLNKKTDSDLIEKLESVANKQAYLKDLIRKDLQSE